ncbi:MAG: hypothetical protein U5L96_17485 [Owenweeksia sp.]|nr:hypothetical protein [Owenweeksia sp.]
MKTIISLSLVFLLALGSLKAQWSKIDSVTQGNINSINFMNADTGFVYHRPGIIRRTANGGQAGSTININFTANINDIDFASANVGYAVGGGGWFPHGRNYPYAIFKTTDGGLSWDSIFSGSNGGMFTHVATLSETEFLPRVLKECCIPMTEV